MVVSQLRGVIRNLKGSAKTLFKKIIVIIFSYTVKEYCFFFCSVLKKTKKLLMYFLFSTFCSVLSVHSSSHHLKMFFRDHFRRFVKGFISWRLRSSKAPLPNQNRKRPWTVSMCVSVCVRVCACTAQQGFLTFLNPYELNYLLQKGFTLTSGLKKSWLAFGSTYLRVLSLQVNKSQSNILV